jgi:hypothetical protein
VVNGTQPNAFPQQVRCPLWVKSRYLQCKTGCPLYPPKADIFSDGSNVRFVPEADMDPDGGVR